MNFYATYSTPESALYSPALPTSSSAWAWLFANVPDLSSFTKIYKDEALVIYEKGDRSYSIGRNTH